MADTDRIGDWEEKAFALTFLIAGVIGFAFEVLHICFSGWEFLDKNGEGVLILLVSLLCGGLGLERLLILRKVRATIETIHEKQGALITKVTGISTTVAEIERRQIEELAAVRKLNQAESLIGTNEIEEAALEIIKRSEDDDDIKATNQYGSEGLSENYVKAIADRVKKADEKGGNMEYQVIMPAKTGSVDEVEDIRRTVFSEQKIEDKLIERHAKHPYPLEVLIVGHSMIIALRGGGSRRTYDVAIKITDPKFVEKAANWFTEIAWSDAETDTKPASRS